MRELESTLKQVQERLKEAEERPTEEQTLEQEENQGEDASNKVHEEEAKFTDNRGYSQEENGELDQENDDSKEENNELVTKKDLEKNGTKTPGQEGSSRWSVVQSMTLQTHCEKLHSIMLPVAFQELLLKDENGLAFVKYKNKVLLNFMHHDKNHVRAVLSRCLKSTAEEVLVDLQKLVLRITKE
ncbi:uncharacterized protein LOC135204985 [Macrobrachium nipponense]|uniref:uncharacterized protein LOC135204985 n=1 Tax=Macrobrachium nipponense TaxID=159736 RepID=UPI0030C87CD5